MNYQLINCQYGENWLTTGPGTCFQQGPRILRGFQRYLATNLHKPAKTPHQTLCDDPEKRPSERVAKLSGHYKPGFASVASVMTQ